MSHDPALFVMAAAEDRGLVARLRALAARVATADEPFAPDAPPDVVVTDYPAQRMLPQSVAALCQSGWTGLIALGAPRPCDASLPSDATDRELSLALTLVARLARLRRHQRDAAQRADHWRQAAATDPLTGLANRRGWEEAVAACRAAPAGGPPVCLAVFDLDRFKPLNDRHGHAAGDAALEAAAAALATHCRPGDLAARLGGDEFALLLRGVDRENALRVVERLRRAVGQGLAAAGRPGLTCSAGAAVGPAADADALLDAADAALLAAKQAGRDRTRVAAGPPEGEPA